MTLRTSCAVFEHNKLWKFVCPKCGSISWHAEFHWCNTSGISAVSNGVTAAIQRKMNDESAQSCSHIHAIYGLLPEDSIGDVGDRMQNLEFYEWSMGAEHIASMGFGKKFAFGIDYGVDGLDKSDIKFTKDNERTQPYFKSLESVINAVAKSLNSKNKIGRLVDISKRWLLYEANTQLCGIVGDILVRTHGTSQGR